jgi:hypothetical protein
MESKFMHATIVDPAIAALLGIAHSVQIVHTITRRPTFTGRISRTFHNGVVFGSGGRSMMPGNGLFLTSYTSMLMGGYSYTGLRRWSISVSAGNSWSEAYGRLAGNYSGVTGTAAVSRQIMSNVHWTFNVSARQYGSPDYSNYNRLIYSVSTGIGFSPGSIPLRIW